MTQLVDFFLGFTGWKAYSLIFLVLLACGFGVPIPEDITLIAGGMLAYKGQADPFLMVVVGMLGVMVGDSTIFLLGSKFGTRLLEKPFFRKVLNPERMKTVQEKLNVHGNKLIFSARFMPGLRSAVFFSSGTLGVPFRVFFFFDGLAALLSVPAIVYATFYFGSELDKVIDVIRTTEHGILAVIVGVILFLVIRHQWKKRKAARAAAAVIGYFTLAFAVSSCAMMETSEDGSVGTEAPSKAQVSREPGSVKLPEQEQITEEDPFIRQSAADQVALDKWCKDLYKEFRRVGWDIRPCKTKHVMHVGGYSNEGRPLVYADFGSKTATNRTLIFSMVHGDEGTPLYVGIRLFQWVREHIKKYPSARVVIAPLVNPDGFFASPKTRVNSRGVDLNRNFLTSDWEEKAIASWKRRYRSDPRRFPGIKPESEPETVFQRDLIASVRPQKILSIHAPLNFIDYDGPSVLQLSKFPEEYIKKCMELRESMKATTGGFFPGSLGNYTGQEKGIPTLTLELPTSDGRRARKYWRQFRGGLKTLVKFEVPNYISQN